MAIETNLDVVVRLLDKATRPMKGVAGAIERHATTIRNVGIGMTAAITAPMMLFANKAINAASDLQEAQNKVSVVFGQSAEAVKAFAETAAKGLGQSEAQALAAAGTFGNLFTAMEIGEQASADMSIGLVRLASDLASFNDIDPTVALEKLRSGIVGEVEPLRTLGVQLSMAAVKTKAAEMGFEAVGGKLSEVHKVTARYALIMEQTAKAQGDFQRTSEDLANATRISKAQFDDLAASVGERLLPFKLKLVTAVGKLIDRFNELPTPMQDTAIKLGGVATAIGPLLIILPSLSGGIKAVTAASQAATGAIAAKGLTSALGGLGGALLPGGAVLVGLAAAVVLMWKTSEWTKAATEDIKAFMKQTKIAEGGVEALEEAGIGAAGERLVALTEQIDELGKRRWQLLVKSGEMLRKHGVYEAQYYEIGGKAGAEAGRRLYKELGAERKGLIEERRYATYMSDLGEATRKAGDALAGHSLDKMADLASAALGRFAKVTLLATAMQQRGPGGMTVINNYFNAPIYGVEDLQRAVQVGIVQATRGAAY